MKHTYSITGMTCQSCADKIEAALSSLDAIADVNVDLEKKEATITMSKHIELNELNKALGPLKKYKLHLEHQSAMNHDQGLPEKSLKTYWPLILVVLYIVFGTFYLTLVRENNEWMSWMPDFMGLFFLAFGFFKLLDVKGFAESYLSYDLPTKAWPTWG
jgi:copper chaperone CopZ